MHAGLCEPCEWGSFHRDVHDFLVEVHDVAKKRQWNEDTGCSLVHEVLGHRVRLEPVHRDSGTSGDSAVYRTDVSRH